MTLIKIVIENLKGHTVFSPGGARPLPRGARCRACGLLKRDFLYGPNNLTSSEIEFESEFEFGFGRANGAA